ncbi:MAG: flagellar FliJ family protein [Methanocorpusculum sp.]|nr:flagellar FliJ family protein [Methanocorpusculum sp.]MDD3897598.1 flagellar FliJ family protein [Syntrophomonadaceae bacterium]
MRAFHFRLQTKLDICQRQEQVTREEMHRRVAIRNQVLQELELLENRFQSLEQSIRELNACHGQFPRIMINRQYIPVLNQQIKASEEHLATAEEAVEEVRMELIERMRETRTLEKLKDKAWHRYLHEMLLEEQKHIDEVAGITHHRKSL